MQIENNDHARELIAAAGINTITVTTRQLKSLHKHVLSLKAIKDNPSLLESMGNPMCRIYSAQWGYYWRPKACGYGAKEEAGLYEFQDAYMTTKHCGPEKKIWYEFVENDEVKA